MSLLGAGISDYQDILVDPDMAGTVLDCMWKTLDLFRRKPGWDQIVIEELRPESPLLAAPPPFGLRAERCESGVCSSVRLPSTMNELESGLPWHFRRSLRTASNRLARLAPTHWVVADAERLPSMMSALFQLHRERWETRGQTGVLNDQRLEAFHAESSREMLRLGLLHMYGLAADDRYLAVLYGFAHARRLYAYLSGFSPSMQSVGPGNLLIRHAIEQAIGEGLTHFDMLRGNEDYKHAWGAVFRPAFRLCVTYV